MQRIFKIKARLEAGRGRRAQTFLGHRSDELIPLLLFFLIFFLQLLKLATCLNELSDWLLGCDGPVCVLTR